MALLLVLAAGCRGPAGGDGPQGPDGETGEHGDAPRISSVEPDRISWGLTVVVRGLDFAPDVERVRVLLDGVEGEIDSVTATEIRVRHLVPAELAEESPGDLVVISDNQVSNVMRVRRMPRGSTVTVPVAALGQVRGIAPRENGALSILEEGRILEVAAYGDISFHASGIPSSVLAPVDRNDGLYYLSAGPNEVRRVADGNDARVIGLPAGEPRALAFDGAMNLYVLIQGPASATILVRDYISQSVSTLVNLPSADIRSMWQQGGVLYLGDLANDLLLEVPIANPFPTVLASFGPASLTGDGTDFLYAYEAERVQEIATADGTVSPWSNLTAGPGVAVDEIARGPDGEIFLRAGSAIWRLPDANTFQSFASPLDGNLVGPLGSSLFAGSGATCGIGDSLGGVLYEVRLDGRLRRAVWDFCGSGAITYSYANSRLLYPDRLNGAVVEYDPFTGQSLDLITFAAGEEPLFVVSDPGGTVQYVAVRDTGSGETVLSSYDASGTLIETGLVPASADEPHSGVVFEDELVLYYGATREVRSAPLPAGGATAAFAPGGFQPDASRLSTTYDDRLLVTDLAGGALWALDSSGTPSRVATVENAASFYEYGDGSLFTVGPESIELVLP